MNLGEKPIPRLAGLPLLERITIDNGYTAELRSTETYSGAGLEEALREFRSSPKFTQLVVRRASVTDDLMKVICEMPNLESLEIDGGDALTDQGMSHLANLTKLRELRVYDCTKVTDASASMLKSLKQLTLLVVMDTGMSKGALVDIANSMPNCEIGY